MRNQDIREALRKSGVKYWELAEKLGICQSWLSVRLRKELTSDEKMKCFNAIQEIIQEREVIA